MSVEGKAAISIHAISMLGVGKCSLRDFFIMDLKKKMLDG